MLTDAELDALEHAASSIPMSRFEFVANDYVVALFDTVLDYQNQAAAIQKAEDHYRKESHEHGKHSRQANNARAKLNETWDRCWSSTHAWYDPHRHEWRTDRDWDHNYDWDHDRDDHDRDDRDRR